MKRIALMMCIIGFTWLCKPAQADALYELFEFSFTNPTVTPAATVSGTVTGTFALPIDCLVACTDQVAVDVTVTDFPVGLDSVVGGAPIVFLPYQLMLPDEFPPDLDANSFSVTAGTFTDAELGVFYEFKNGLLDDAIGLELDLGGTENFLLLGGEANLYGALRSLNVSNDDGIDGLTFTPAGSILVAPEPVLWPMLWFSFAALVLLRRYRLRAR
jgi:hypothetical protein